MTRKLTLTALTALVVLAALSAPVAAQSTATATPGADYYENETTDTGTDSWLSGLTDASLDDVLTLAMRLGTYVIGGGVTAQGGVGSAGALLTGLLVAGVIGSIGVRSGAGTSGGLVIGVMAAFMFVTVGIGATWAYPVVLFVVGLLVAAVFLRLLR